MSKLTDLLKIQRDLKAEAGTIVKTAKDAKAEMTAEQKTRFEAIETSLKDLDAKFDALAAEPDVDAVRIEGATAVEKASKDAAEASAKQVRDLSANIAAACAMAGQAAKASAFIKDAKPLADVVTALQAGKVDTSGREISNHGGGNGGGGNGGSDPAQIAASWDDVTAKVNSQFGIKR